MALALSAVLALACVTGLSPPPPAIAVIIDDLGYQLERDRAALDLPGALTYAILPFSPHAHELARAARAASKDVILHLPMEATDNNHLLGPGALTSTLPDHAFRQRVRAALAAVPFIIGVNNHMGSALSRDHERMRWVMEELHGREVFYVDSRTTPHSVAGIAAGEANVRFVGRDVFLDHKRNRAAIEQAFEQLLARARSAGDALAIAHPYAQSMAVLRDRLAALDGVELVPLTALVTRRACARQSSALAARGPHRRERASNADHREQPER